MKRRCIRSRICSAVAGGSLAVVMAYVLALRLLPALASPELAGGFIEKATSATVRSRLTRAQIQAFLPDRGKFTFPPPYNTVAIRLTNATDCGGTDCVHPVGYSYWRNINNHVGSNTMLIFLGLDKARGGHGPTLFSLNKVTHEVRNLGPLFERTSPLRAHSGEGWYFSATRPTTLYLNEGPKLLRYDVVTKQFQTVFDVGPRFGRDKYIWQAHSSNDDRVHSATLRQDGTWDMLGCVVYREDTQRFLYYPKQGDYDECQIDKSGQWLVIKENLDRLYGEDNRIIDLSTGIETILLDQDGAGGHSDNGYGYLVADDNRHKLSGAVRIWRFGRKPLGGPVVFHRTDRRGGIGHISHSNAKPGIPAERQYACGAAATRVTAPHLNEVLCFRLDPSLDVLVVAPVMTDLDATGGGDDYAKLPKGSLDVSGRYFIWTSNMAGPRVDAFVVEVPADWLVAEQPLAAERQREHR